MAGLIALAVFVIGSLVVGWRVEVWLGRRQMRRTYSRQQDAIGWYHRRGRGRRNGRKRGGR